MLRGECNVVDLLLSEALRVFHPVVLDKIWRLKDLLTGQDVALVATRGQEAANAQLESVLEGLGVEAKASARGLLRALFPGVLSIWDNRVWDPRAQEEWYLSQRIASPFYFDRYFTLTLGEGEVSDADIARLIEAIRDGDQPTAAATADGSLTPGTAAAAITALTLRATELTNDSTERLLVLLTTFGEGYPTEGSGLLQRSPREDAALLIARLLSRLDATARMRQARVIVQTAEPVGFAAECFQKMRALSSGGEEGRLFSDDDLASLGALLAQRIVALDERTPITETDPDACSLLYWIAVQFGSADRLRANISGRLVSSEQALALIRCYLSRASDGNTGMPLPPVLAADGYAELVRLVDADRLTSALGTEFELEGGQDDIVNVNGPSDWEDADLARHFAAVHRAAALAASAEGSTDEGD
jgi:hypothetical protein